MSAYAASHIARPHTGGAGRLAHPGRSARLSLVTAGDHSAAWNRRAHARAVARGRDWAVARTYAALGAVFTVFGAAVVTVVTAFLAVPNVPLP